MMVCITAGDGTQPVWANPGKKAVCREPHGGEGNAEAGQGSRLLPWLPRSPGGTAGTRLPKDAAGMCTAPRGSASPAGPGVGGEELRPVSGGTSQSAFYRARAGVIYREAFKEMSSSWAPAKAQPRWALPGVLWQLLLGKELVGGQGWQWRWERGRGQDRDGNGDGNRGEDRTGMGMGMGTGVRTGMGLGMGTGMSMRRGDRDGAETIPHCLQHQREITFTNFFPYPRALSATAISALQTPVVLLCPPGTDSSTHRGSFSLPHLPGTFPPPAAALA